MLAREFSSEDILWLRFLRGAGWVHFRSRRQHDGFVHKVETEFFTGNPFVATGQECPLINECLQHFRIAKNAAFFFGDVDPCERLIQGVKDAVPGRSVQAQIDVDPIFVAETNGAIDGRNFLFLNSRKS